MICYWLLANNKQPIYYLLFAALAEQDIIIPVSKRDINIHQEIEQVQNLALE